MPQEKQAPLRKPEKQGDREPRKSYVKPEIIHELELETRAGTPIDIPDPFDPTSGL